MNKLITAMLTCIWFHAYADINTYFEQHIKKSPTELHAFLKQMPTGGELHFHLAGAAYAEHLLKITKNNNWCINPKNFQINTECSRINKKYLNKLDYEKILEAWSMKKFDYSKQIGAEHFFNTFFKLMPVVIKNSPELLTEVIQRAARQNELYLEIMIIPDDAKSLAFGKDIGGTINTIQQFNAARQKLLSISGFQKNINFAVLRTKNDFAKAKKLLGCNKTQSKKCQLEVKFQYYLLREVGVKAFFSEAVTAFEAAQKSDEIVGINIVQKEHGPLSMKYYNQQMAIIHYLKGLYPTVHIALHAGELIPDFVKPQDIKYHIHNAIFIGQAERIGHGTDIMYEDNASELANYMATHHIPVEINLTSNADVLNVKGANHPIYFYLKHHVPIVLSTDDEGILRTNLTHEYYKAVMEYGIDYPTLKQFNRNTLTYSFLPGKSIWKDADRAVLVHECAVLDSNRCRIYQINNPKAKLQVKLEMELKRFEGKFESK